MNRVLPEDRYRLTCVDFRRNEKYNGFPHWEIVWKVNSGEFSYSTVIDRFPDNEKGLTRMATRLSDAEFVMWTNPETELFYKQFIGIKVVGNVVQSADKGFIRNFITGYKAMVGIPEYNVLTDAKDTKFYVTSKPKQLPIREN